MSQDVGAAKGWPDSGLIYCEKCGRSVERYKIEYGIRTETMAYGRLRKVHTGEIIMTIECHGERWRMSNLRGRLPAEIEP